MTRISGRALADLLPDLSAQPGPRYSALAGAISGLLLDGRVALGTKLPSERELAQSLELSRATVTNAYDALRADGLLASRTGSGSVTALPRRPHPESGSIGRREISTRGPVERLFARYTSPGPAADGAMIDLAVAAMPAPPELTAAAERAAGQLHLYADHGGYQPAGMADLRAGIADRFAGRGVLTRPEQILITNGAQNAIDLLLRLLVAPGERVLTELPTYSGLLDAVRANGARPVAVPMDPGGGWQIGPMVAALRQSTPALAVLIPDFHNPTGHLASADHRHDIVRAARRVGTTVVVDESFIELGFVPPAIPMAALGPDVISIGSLSKPVWGGLRVGWVRASAELIHRLTAVRAAVDMGQSVLDQLLVVALLDDLDGICTRCRAQVLPQRDALLGELNRRFPAWRTNRPDGGLSMWVELDAPLATALAVRAGQYGVRVVAGSRFGLDGTMERFLRLPYALPPAELARAMALLAAAWVDLDASATGYSPLVVA